MLVAILVIVIWPEKSAKVSESSHLIADRNIPVYVEFQFSDGTQYRIEVDPSTNMGTTYILSNVDESFDPNWTSQDQLERLFKLPTTLSPTKTITEVSDYDQYGLSQPEALIDVAFSPDHRVTLKVGGVNNDGDLQYLQIAGEDEVYAVESNSLAFIYLGERSLITNNLLSSDYSIIQAVSFQRRSDNFAVSFEAIHSSSTNGMLPESWQMIKPISFMPGSLSMNFLRVLMDFTVESYLPVDTEPSLLGLDDPEFTITVYYSSGESQSIYLSKRPEGGYFGRVDDFLYPFTLSSVTLDSLDAEPVNFFSLYLYQMKPSDISKLDFYSNDFEYQMDVDILESETLESDRASASLNFVSLKTLTDDGRTKFDVIYDVLSSVRISGYDPESIPNPEITTFLTITLRDRTQVKYSFSNKNDREMFLFINDTYSGLTINTGTLMASDSDFELKNSLEGIMKYVLGHLDA